jgi:flavin reductase (DIM6/NTAB) family NADH-FMN oxidoreductase RutF
MHKNNFKSIQPENIPQGILHQYLVSAVAPRPIAFVSTIDINGNVNLAPYSFFNCFSSNPPILVFSSNRRGGDNTTKDTLHNVISTKEAVINIVHRDIVRQMSLCSIDYETHVNEFEKSGLTMLPSEIVKAPRVAESNVQMECKVKDIISLGEKGGAGNLIICEVVFIHINTAILNEKEEIDVHKIHHVGRLGKAYYADIAGDAIFKLFQPFNVTGIGFDNLPNHVKKSTFLSGNEIAEMAALPSFPEKKHHHWNEEVLIINIKKLIAEGKADEALSYLL